MKKFALHAFPCFVLNCNVEICRYFVEFSFRYQQKHESYFEFIIIHTANLHKISFYPLTKDFLSRKLPNPRNLSHFRKQTRRRKITFPRGGIFSRQSDTIRVCIRMLEERERERQRRTKRTKAGEGKNRSGGFTSPRRAGSSSLDYARICIERKRRSGVSVDTLPVALTYSARKASRPSRS